MAKNTTDFDFDQEDEFNTEKFFADDYIRVSEEEAEGILDKRFKAYCGKHSISAKEVREEINRSVLRMSKKDYMKKNKIGEPLNDNIPLSLLVQKNFAVGITTNKLFQTPVGTINLPQAKTLAYKSGKVARYIGQNLDRLESEAEAEED
jgi:hypothetical protein